MSKVWMITGASRGIGLEIARTALDAGHQVVAAARRPEQILKALPDHGDRLFAVPLDVTKPAQAQAAVEAAKQKFGRIDVLVNNAGYGQIGWFENTSDRQIRDQFETNVFGSMNVTRAVLPLMREQRSGHIFTYSSIAGVLAFAGSSVYSASKFAVEGWMEGLSQEVKPLGIAATIVEPGFFRTDFLDTSSIAYGEYDVADYAEASAAFKKWHDEKTHQQPGDPAKLGATMLKLAEMPQPPLRFAAGSDAVEFVLSKADSLRAEAEQLRWLSISTDGTDQGRVHNMSMCANSG
jgi:NAD(P)-dependent dehydrogenase (short-subunit alcohol dehydrogenase family)